MSVVERLLVMAGVADVRDDMVAPCKLMPQDCVAAGCDAFFSIARKRDGSRRCSGRVLGTTCGAAGEPINVLQASRIPYYVPAGSFIACSNMNEFQSSERSDWIAFSETSTGSRPGGVTNMKH